MRPPSFDDSKVMSIRLSNVMRAKIKAAGEKRGMTPSVFVRSLLYERFANVPDGPEA